MLVVHQVINGHSQYGSADIRNTYLGPVKFKAERRLSRRCIGSREEVFGFNRYAWPRPRRVLFYVYKRFRNFSSSPKKKEKNTFLGRISQQISFVRQRRNETKRFHACKRKKIENVRDTTNDLVAHMTELYIFKRENSLSLRCRKK